MFAGNSGAFPLCAKGLTRAGVTRCKRTSCSPSSSPRSPRPAAVPAASSRPLSRRGRAASTCSATSPGAAQSRRCTTSRTGKPFFPGVDSSYKFCLLSLTGKALREPVARYAFFLLDIAELDDANRVFALTPEELALISPNTGTLPIFRTRRDADLTAAIYRRMPVLCDDTKRDGNPWGITFKYVFSMTDDADLLRTRESWSARAGGWTATSSPATASACFRCTRRRWSTFSTTGCRRVQSETAVNRQNQPRLLSLEKQRSSDGSLLPRYWIAEDGPNPIRRTARRSRFRVYLSVLAEEVGT